MPVHLSRSKFLRKKIDSHQDRRWKIITLVREPIGRYISSLFQNLSDINPRLINPDGSINTEEVNQFLQNYLIEFIENTDFACSWFDK